MVRTPSFDKNGMKKGAWSPEEDNKLRAYIHRYGHWNWRELPKYAANLELQSHESPRSEINQVTDELGSKDVTDEIYQQILESSPLSSRELSSSDFSSGMTSDYALLSDKNWVGEDSMSSSESFEESVRNFWIEPVFEDFSFQQNEFSSNLAEGESMFPCFLDHDDDSIEWFHQILNELPEK
ncbi:Transcription factor MYB93 [Camellia lanceoleosa]|uniref:Transcription factor MYB93 n=1 Tax=Camellia lanceoleosa TaxID=1840588 RepID=A0ACC0H2P5_9ERIC|nr:Transcription factor MYB93 [Camellia lanceoleosa]